MATKKQWTATRKRKAEDDEPYFIEVDTPGCTKCGGGKTYCVIGPDGVASSVSYDNEEDAAALAEALNEAYFFGRGVA